MTAIPPPEAPLSLQGALGDAGAGRDGADAGGAADACRGGSSGGRSREKWLCISYTSKEKLRKLEDALRLYPLPLTEVVPLFAALLSLPLPASYPLLTLTPQRQKQKTLQALLTWLLVLTEQPCSL